MNNPINPPPLGPLPDGIKNWELTQIAEITVFTAADMQAYATAYGAEGARQAVEADRAQRGVPVSQWVATKDQMPPEGVRVFFLDERSNRVGYDTWCGDDFSWSPSHWMHIPPLATAHTAPQQSAQRGVPDARDGLRADQAAAVMPLIGTLLDAWDSLPNDLKLDEEFSVVRRSIGGINRAMLSAAPTAPQAQPTAQAAPRDERKAFEVWGNTQGTPEQGWWFRPLPDGGYSAELPDVAWKAWQARAALPQGEPQQGALPDEKINALRDAVPVDIEDRPEPWAFRQGFRAAERHHGISASNGKGEQQS